MKKFLIAILAVICVACAGFAAACAKPYYTLTFNAPEGVTVVCEADSGAQVQQGYEITFTLEKSDKTEGEAIVKVNDETITPDASGVYKFKMQKDTVVEITGVIYTGETVVTFDNGNNDFAGFYDLEGQQLKSLEVRRGDEVKFKTHVSVYYDEYEYGVVAGSNVLSADNDGVYTLTVNSSVTVAFKGLPENIAEKSFAGIGDGNGTEQHPFIIRSALDLFMMSYLIGDGYDGGSEIYHMGYYVLDNDIDMRGEKLYVIGDGRTASSVFAGVFDGNGHTISNYYMDDEVIDQTSYQKVKLSCVGLFGYMVAATNTPSGVYNLNLKNFEINVDGGSLETSVTAGGIVGLGVGITVSNCTVNGNLTVDANSDYFGYVGGVIGLQQSAYNDETGMRYLSVVQSCSSEVTIMGTSGFVLAAGGITGYIYSFEERSTAAILNSYSNSTISGAMRAGGIAGMVNAYSSVKNCYTSGYIEAESPLELRPGLEAYAHAYAGGIAGYAEHDSIISDSYSTADCDAYSQVNNYNHADGILGGAQAKDEIYLHAEVAIVSNTYSTQNTAYGEKISSVTDGWLKNTLLWDEQDWHFNGDGKPTVEQEGKSKTFTINVVVVGNDNGGFSLDVTDRYVPMSLWYTDANGISEYLKSGDLRTYGYYFDRELTHKVPFGYIPTHGLTIYCAYTDHSEVTGTYYLADGAYIILDGDGFLTYRNGAICCVSTYYYNGNLIVLENTFFAILLHEDFGFYTYVAELDGSNLKIYARQDDYSYLDGNNQVITVSNYTKDNPLTATKRIENFNYGSYYSADGTSYTFNADGSGVIQRANSGDRVNFTYVLSGDELTVSYSGTTGVCKVQDGTVCDFDGAELSRYDQFRGEWEKASSAHIVYSFDGIGNWTYVCYGYDSNGNKVEKQTASGTYTVNGGVLSFDGSDITAQLKDGLLYIGGEKYGAVNGFAGVWVYNNQQYTVEVTLNGITTDGYGTGTLSYSGTNEVLEINYEVVEVGGKLAVAIYYFYEGYGLLTFDPSLGTLSGNLYIYSAGDVISGIRLCMYDDFRGLWTAEGGALDGKEVRFNGLGNYNFAGSGNVMQVKGNVYVDNKLVGSYTLDEFTLTGSLEYNGKTYEIEYNAEDCAITVKSEEGNCVLTKSTVSEAD